MNGLFGPQSYTGMRQKYTALRVNGKEGAHSFASQMFPDSTALALDTTADMLWVMQTDSSGYPSIMGFDITPHAEPEPVDINALMQRITRLEEMISGKHSTGRTGQGNGAESGEPDK